MKNRKRMILKKILLGVAIGLFAMALTATSESRTIQSDGIGAFECEYGRCIKIKADGTQCKNCAQRYSSYCWSHRK